MQVSGFVLSSQGTPKSMCLFILSLGILKETETLPPVVKLYYEFHPFFSSVPFPFPFCSKDEKNQVLITNAWLQMVSNLG